MKEGRVTVASSAGVGPLFLMFLIFMTLKLTGFIGWSWLWVTAPLWLPAAIFLSCALLALFFFIIVKLIKD